MPAPIRKPAIGLILAALMMCMSYWQWSRYQGKLPIVAQMRANLETAITPFEALRPKDDDFAPLLYRRVSLTGKYDFEHEMILRNRRFEEIPGVFLITPLKLDSGAVVLVQRGFIPLDHSKKEHRSLFQTDEPVAIVGLIKPPKVPAFFIAPQDPPSGPPHPWIDAWLRVDIEKMARQLPYKPLPIYVERMSEAALVSTEAVTKRVLRSDETRDDMLFFPMRAETLAHQVTRPLTDFPHPVFDSVIPPGRHLGYVYEWAFMALGTLIITVFLHFRRKRKL
jgi:cytochrome oxidase assembly protein ShyY1